MKKFNDEKSAVDSAWELFEKTGKINYYLLYQKLKKK